MKKLILLLLISGGLSAQVVIPKSTTTFSNISATGNLTVTGNAKISGAITSPTLYGSSAASGTLNLIGTSSATAGVISAGGVGTNGIKFQGLVGTTTESAIYFNVASPTAGSYNLTTGNSNTEFYVNGPSAVKLQVGTVSILSAFTNQLICTPFAATSGAKTAFDLRVAGNYSQTASTNIPAFKVTGATRGWLTGAIPTQYENHFTAPTYTAAGASTITTAAGLYVAKPIMGTNMTATNIYGIATDGAIGSTSKTDGIGYAVGSGSTVTQATSRTTGVTINSVTGSITLVSAAGTTSWQTFTVSNSAVAATDVIVINQKSGTDLNEIHITAVVAGSFNVSFKTTGGTTVEQPVFNFAVIKGQTN